MSALRIKKIILIFLFIITTGIGWIIFKLNQSSGIVYVRSADLIYQYQGMKEAQKKQEKKTEELRSGLDTLQLHFQTAIAAYNREFPKLSKEERQERERNLSMQQNELKLHSQTVDENIRKQDEELTQGVLNQINSFIESYANDKGYDLVLGTTTSGNILYGKGQMDITEEVLQALNEHYTKNPNMSTE